MMDMVILHLRAGLLVHFKEGGKSAAIRFVHCRRCELYDFGHGDVVVVQIASISLACKHITGSSSSWTQGWLSRINLVLLYNLQLRLPKNQVFGSRDDAWNVSPCGMAPSTKQLMFL